MARLEIKELVNAVLNLNANDFEELVNVIKRLQNPETHLYDRISNKDGGIDGWCKNKSYKIGCYSPENDRKLDFNKIVIDMLKDIRLVKEYGFEKSLYYINSNTIGSNIKGNVFETFVKSSILQAQSAIEYVHQKGFKPPKYPKYLKNYYEENETVKFDNIRFEYFFVDKVIDEIYEVIDSKGKNRVIDELANIINLEEYIIDNNDIDMRDAILESTSNSVSEKMDNIRDNSLNNSCQYTKFLVNNFERAEQLKMMGNYLRLDENQKKRGMYLGYDSEMKHHISEIKLTNSILSDANYLIVDKFNAIYNNVVGINNFMIHPEINDIIFKGLCGHIGSEKSTIYKENGGIDWNDE